MNILVTGACGQLGMELRLAAAESPNRFIFTDIVGEAECLDITSPEAVSKAMEAYKPEIIVNCAAYTNVEKAEEAREEAYKVNCKAVENLASAAASCGATLIHISTDYVFDGRSRKPYTEDDDVAPLNVYGETKLAGERAVVASGCKYLIFRTSWLHSPFGNNFVKSMLRLLRERDEVKVVDDQIGTPTYATDLAGLLLRLIDGGLHDRTGIYNYSNEGECSRYEYVTAIAELSGYGNIKPCKTKDYPSKAVRPEYSVLDKSKVREVFGIEIPYWRDSLAACIASIERFL
ncbi:MAG: dTDP-4-dehydrorhamnose reductase [Bacteroidales bacterium]|nr:dTDP-4-dehydrorhamnose reductase [Bacteroidales bacterium]